MGSQQRGPAQWRTLVTAIKSFFRSLSTTKCVLASEGIALLALATYQVAAMNLSCGGYTHAGSSTVPVWKQCIPRGRIKLLFRFCRLTCWLADERPVSCMQSQAHRARLAAVRRPALQQQLQQPAARQPQQGERKLLRRCSQMWRLWPQSCSKQGQLRCDPCRLWSWGGWCRREAVPGHALGRLR